MNKFFKTILTLSIVGGFLFFCDYAYDKIEKSSLNDKEKEIQNLKIEIEASKNKNKQIAININKIKESMNILFPSNKEQVQSLFDEYLKNNESGEILPSKTVAIEVEKVSK